MIKRSTFYFLIIILLSSVVFSCNGEVKRKLLGIRKSYPPSLIRNHLLFSELSNEYSFPIWFNDSIIELNNVFKIKRLVYPKSLTESSHGDSTFIMPSETTEYTFRKNGSIEKISHAFYFDDRKISEFEFFYEKSPDNAGYSKVRFSQESKVYSDSTIKNNLSQSEQLALYNRKKQESQFLEFENRNTGDFLYFIPKKEFWGPLDIDRYIRPNPNDILVLGNIFLPNKIYQVENKVNENNVVEFKYKNGSINLIQTNSYPFHSTRNFLYNSRGHCTGFIDSTFSENNYLTRTISRFENNMIFSPTKIYHRKENSDGKLTIINYEEFVYEYHN